MTPDSRVIDIEHGMVCPHCRSQVPPAASVCCGCKAEISYGPPSEALVVLLVLCALVGFTLGDLWTWLGWVGGLLMYAFGAKWLGRLFAHRAEFRRHYHT